MPPDADWQNQLYRAVSPGALGAEVPSATVTAVAVPYYAWANRAPGPMQVWVRDAGR